MDTKWKKSKVIISWFLFFLSINLLLETAAFLVENRLDERSIKAVILNAREEDYQNTDEFKYYLSECLRSFISMGAKKPFNNGNYYYNSLQESDIEYGTGNIIVGETTVYEGAANSSSNSEWTPEDAKKRAEEIHNSIKNDKNMLYNISYDNKTVYTNGEDVVLDGSYENLPEAYNYLLYFDGSKVTITKDGKEINPYKGSEYDGWDMEWQIPGYSNYILDEEEKKVTVCIAAAKRPIQYYYNSYEGHRNTNELYWIAYNNKNDRKILIKRGIKAILGLVLFLLCLLLHKSKKAGDKWIAGVMGKVWLEVKAAAAIGLLGILFFWEKSWWHLWQRDMWGYEYYSGIAYFMRFFSRSENLILIFWLFYLLFLEIRFNKMVWKQSLIIRVLSVFQTKNYNLSFQKKKMRQHQVVYGVETALVLLSIVCYLTAWLSPSNTAFWRFFGTAVAILLLLFLLVAGYYDSRQSSLLLRDMELLIHQIAFVRDGNLTDEMPIPEEEDLSQAAKNLNEIQQGMEIALNEKLKSEQMKVELVSNVSHDIKTPLTSIISYVDLLKQEDVPDNLKDYIHILDQKSQRLKSMVQDVFEISKAASGQLPIKMEILDYAKLLRQTLADMQEEINNSSISLITQIPEESISISADGQRLYRVFQNIIQNALKYSLDGSRIYIVLTVQEEKAKVSVKNTSKMALQSDFNYTERFTRGDKSRTDGGSGLGLSIARSFTEACGGRMDVEVNADLFTVVVEFSLCQEKKEN